MQKVEPGGMTSAVTSSLPTIHRPVKIKAPNEPPRAISRPSQNFLNAYPTSTSGLITSSRPHERHSKRPQLIKVCFCTISTTNLVKISENQQISVSKNFRIQV